MKNQIRHLTFFVILLISLLMHLPHFSKDLIGIHVWRQTQTQSTINNFYEEDMNILNPRRNERGNGDGIFRMEFPLMQWSIAGLYKIFGQHLIITRIVMFIIGLFSILGVYYLLFTLFKNQLLALMGAWAFNFSPSFFYYTINPLPDNLALCFSIWALYFFFDWISTQKNGNLIWSSICLGLATLCKLPFVLYYAVPFTYFLSVVLKKEFTISSLKRILILFVGFMFPLIWYLMVIPEWQGNGIVHGMFSNEVPFSTILEYLSFNLFSTIPELFLNFGSVPFFLLGFYFLYKNGSYKNKVVPMLLVLSAAVLAYFFFEINMIRKAHDYYLFPFYPLLFMLVGYGAYSLFKKGGYYQLITFFLLLILPLTCYLRMGNRWNMDQPNFNVDLLKYKKELQAATPKDAPCIVGNDYSHFIYFYHLDKKGWGFQDDKITDYALKGMIQDGAAYLYSDSRGLDEQPALQPFFEKLILERGSIRVYKLKKISSD